MLMLDCLYKLNANLRPPQVANCSPPNPHHPPPTIHHPPARDARDGVFNPECGAFVAKQPFAYGAILTYKPAHFKTGLLAEEGRRDKVT